MTHNDVAGYVLAAVIGIVLLAFTGYAIWDAVTSHILWLKEREAHIARYEERTREENR